MVGKLYIDEFYEDIASRVDRLKAASSDAESAIEQLKKAYEVQRDELLKGKNEAEILEARLASKTTLLSHRRQSEGIAEIDGLYNARLQELSREAEKELRTLQGRRDHCSKVLQRIPSDLAQTPIRPEHVQQAKNTPDEALERLLAEMADTSFITWLKRLLHLKGTMRRDEACSLLKAMVQDERNRIEQGERSMRSNIEQHKHALQNEWAEKRAEVEREARQIADAQAPDASASRGFEVKLRSLEADYEEKKHNLEMRQKSTDEAERVGDQCRADIRQRVQELGNADTGALRQATTFPRYTPIGMVAVKGAGLELRVPYSFDWDNLQGCWFTVDGNKEPVLEWIRAIVSTAIRCTPLGALEVYWLDPTNAGLSLGKLAELSSRIEVQDDSIISVASTEDDTGRLISVLQERLGQFGPAVAPFGGLRAYNARPNAVKPIPQTIVVVNDLSNKQFGTRALDLVEYIITNGAALGTQLLVTCDMGLRGDESTDTRLKSLRDSLTCITQSWDSMGYGITYCIDIPGRGRKPIMPINPGLTSDALVRSVKQAQSRMRDTQHIAPVDLNAIQVPSIEEGLNIPIGIDELGNAAMLKMGIEANSSAHAIVTGTTGSGKTVFLRNVIESLCTHYSPNELEIWVVDYKRSEFSSLSNAEMRFPHISMVAIDTSEEFIKAFNKRLYDGEMKRRQSLLVNAGDIHDINEYNRYVGLHPELELEPLRHLLVIIDEFHKQATVMKNDPSCSQRFSDLISECRVYGIHVMISNQQLSSKAMTGLGDVSDNMTCRVLLQWGQNTQETRMMLSSEYAMDLKPLGQGGAYIQHASHRPVRCTARNMTSELFRSSVGNRRNLLGDCSIWDDRFEYLDATRRDNPSLLQYQQNIKTNYMGSRVLPIGSKPDFSNPALCMSLESRKGENLFIFGQKLDLALDLAETMTIAAGLQWGLAAQVVIVAPERNPSWLLARENWSILNRVLPACSVISDIDAIERLFQDAAKERDENSAPLLIVVFGLDEICDQMVRSAHKRKMAAVTQPPQQSQPLPPLFSDPSSGVFQPFGGTQGEVGDPREFILQTIEWGPINNVHTCLVSPTTLNLRKILGVTGMLDVSDLFAHRFVTRAEQQRLSDIGMSSLAFKLSDDDALVKMVYHAPDGQETVFRPYEVRGILHDLATQAVKPSLGVGASCMTQAARATSVSETRDGDSEWLW